MANINIENISDLALNGKDLFKDSESFMTELSDDSEQDSIMGGLGGCGWTVDCTRGTCTQTVVTA